MYEFYPEGFVPDEAFYRQVKLFRQYHRETFVWIENPADGFRQWRWISANLPGCLELGAYKIYLTELSGRAEQALTIRGGFERCGTRFHTSEIVLSTESGVLQFRINGGGETEMFAALDAKIAYVMPAGRQFAEDAGEMKADGRTDDRSMKSAALLSDNLLYYKGGADFAVTLSPAQLWDGSRTYIALPAEEYAGTMTDRLGRAYTLVPAQDASLVFARMAGSVYYDGTAKQYRTGQQEFYLTFQGGFRLRNGGEILLGLYGMEYMAECDMVTFRPGHAAFLIGEDAWDDGATTAWMSLTGAYYSMPEGAPLYAVKDGILQPCETPVAVFDTPTEAFPCFPWKNAHFSERLKVNEVDDLLYRKRYAILAEGIRKAQSLRQGEREETTEKPGLRHRDAAATAEAQSLRHADVGEISWMQGTEGGEVRSAQDTEAGMVAVTPEGLCVGMEQSAWRWLGIAQNSDCFLPDVRIYDITPAGKEKLLSKDCFVVITSREEYAAFGSGEIALAAEGWRVSLKPEEWNDAILIIKYGQQLSVREKLSGNAVLEELINRAYRKSEIKEAYREFISLVSDRQFQGVLLLHTRAWAERDKVQPEVWGALAMTGEDSLDCVYAAVKRSRVVVEENQIRVMPSRMDMLIAYESEGILAAETDCGCTCRTVGLHVKLRSSHVTDFSSRTELLPKSLLGERLVSPAGAVLSGRLELQNGVAVYRFLLEGPVTYACCHKPVETIEIESASMAARDGENHIRLGGRLHMAQMEECDIFSYDALAFDGLEIITEGCRGREDSADLRLYQQRSTARQDSLAAAFGAVPQRYLVNHSAATPDGLGFSSVTTPVQQGEISAGWNGVVHRFRLGSSGALGADQALYFDFIAAWKEGNFYFGVCPGGAFAREFSLQNLLGVGFQSISLVQAENQKPLFRLNSLSLKLLGLSVPPKSADLYLFGDQGRTGWYFGYAEEEQEG